MKKANIAVNILRILFLIMVLGLVVYFLFNRDKFTVDAIINLAPENLFLAAVVILILYGLKSLTVFFPVLVLQIAVGIMYGPVWGVLVNILGAVCEGAVPYLFARYTGLGEKPIDKLMKKYPQLERVIEEHSKNQLFLSFFLRVLGFLPLDIISMLLGVLKINFFKFSLGTVLGMLPGILAATIMGNSITNIFSPQFIISFAATGVISISALIIYIVYYKRKKKTA